MKRVSRLMSVALAAVMLLSISSAALADDTKVYIPNRIAKLGLPAMPQYITLKTRTDRARMYDTDGKAVMSTTSKDRYSGEYIQNYGITEDAGIELEFSQKPDWAGVIWAEGYENLDVDENGRAVTSMEGHLRQPGTWSSSAVCDPVTGLPAWHVTGGDYAFLAGKGPVTAQYSRSGSINYVEYTVEDDFFRTGMPGVSTVVKYEPVRVDTDSGSTLVWFISTVTATYPAGNYIVGVEATYRNDEKNTLAGYRITYAVGDAETYKITYAPTTRTVYEYHTYKEDGRTDKIYIDYLADDDGYILDKDGKKIPVNIGDNVPSTKGKPVFLHHYVEDEVLSGEYSDGTVTLVSGSGDNLRKWYKAGHGKQVKKNGLKPCTSFISPRVQ